MESQTPIHRRPLRSADRNLHVRLVRYRPDIEVCKPIGEIDLCTVELLRDVLRETERRGLLRIFIDLSEVEFLAVCGVQVLITAAEHAWITHRQLSLVAPPRPAHRVLKLTGALDSLVTYPNLADATAALAVPRPALNP